MGGHRLATRVDNKTPPIMSGVFILRGEPFTRWSYHFIRWHTKNMVLGINVRRVNLLPKTPRRFENKNILYRDTLGSMKNETWNVC